MSLPYFGLVKQFLFVWALCRLLHHVEVRFQHLGMVARFISASCLHGFLSEQRTVLCLEKPYFGLLSFSFPFSCCSDAFVCLTVR